MARSLNSIMSSITTMSDDAAAPDLFAVLYSEFGVGKTVATMAIAQAIRGDGDILFCDSSDGWTSLADFEGMTDDADLFRATDPADLIPIANGLKSGKLKSKRKNRYSVVVLDEGSSMFDVMLEQSVREKYGLSPDDPFPEIEGREYGPATMAFESMLRKFHDIEGLHVIVTAHAREVGETKELRPSLPPKAYNVLMRKAQVCAALSARRRRDPKTKELSYDREVQLQPSAAVSAKSRMPNSPVKMNVDDFIEAISEWVNSDTFVSDIQGKAARQEVAEIEEAPEELEGDDEDFTPETLREHLKEMSIGDIRKLADEDYDLDLSGVKKPDAIERLVEHFFGE